jgi:hypothetical protein
MFSHMKLISDLNQARGTCGADVWRSLCHAYCSRLMNPATLFHRQHDYFYLAKSFCNDEKSDTSIKFFSAKLNQHFQFGEHSNRGDFLQLLQAFLICYPEYLSALDDTIIKNLTINPYRITLKSNAAEKVITALKNPDSFVISIRVMPFLRNFISDDEFKITLAVLLEGLGSDDYYPAKASKAAWHKLHPKLSEHEFKFITSVLIEKLNNNDIKIVNNAINALALILELPFINIEIIVSALIAKLTSKEIKIKRQKIFFILLNISQRDEVDANAIAFALATSGDWCSTRDLRDKLILGADKNKLDVLFHKPSIDYKSLSSALQFIVQDNSIDEKTTAIFFLGYLTARSQGYSDKIVDLLIEQLGNVNRKIRIASADALEILSSNPQINFIKVIPALLAVFNDTDNNILSSFSTDMERLLDPNVDYFNSVMDALTNLALSQPVDYNFNINKFLSLLENGTTIEKMLAVDRLGKIAEKSGQQLDRIVPVLMNALIEFDAVEESDAIYLAITALCELSNRLEINTMDIANALIARLHPQRWKARDMIVDYLGEIACCLDVYPNEIVAALKSVLILDYLDTDTRASVSQALAKVCYRSDVDVELVITALLDAPSVFEAEDSYLQNVLIGVMQAIFAETRAPITSALLYMLEVLPTADSPKRKLIVEALYRIAIRYERHADLIASALVLRLNDEYKITRRLAVYGLCAIGRRTNFNFEPYFESLATTLTDSKSLVRSAVVSALATLALSDDVKTDVSKPVSEDNAVKRKRYDGYQYHPLHFSKRVRREEIEEKTDSPHVTENDQQPTYKNLPYIISLIIPSLEDNDVEVQITTVESLGEICKKAVDITTVVAALLAKLQKSDNSHVKIAITYVLMNICKLGKIDPVTVFRALATQLNNDIGQPGITDAVIYLFKNKIEEKDKNHCFFGILLKKYYDAVADDNNFYLLEAITSISERRTLNFYIHTHLPSQPIVNIVASYLSCNHT